MGPVVKLLQAIANLTRSGAIKKLDDAYRLAQRELGDRFSQYQNQIKDAFDAGIRKQKSADIIPFRKKEGIESLGKGRVKEKGEVIEASFKPGVDKRGKKVEPSPSQDQQDFLRRVGKAIEEAKKGIDTLQESEIFKDTLEAAKKMQQQKNLESSPLMKRLEGGVESLKKGINLTSGLSRTIAREMLMNKGIKIAKGTDPLELVDKKFGADITSQIADLADELIEMERMGTPTKNLNVILKQEGLLDLKMPNEPRVGFTPEELEEIQKAIDEEDVLLKFDPTDRKPNADGGLNYLMGM